MLRPTFTAGLYLLIGAIAAAQVEPLPPSTPTTPPTIAPTTARSYRAKEVLGSMVNIEGNTRVGVVDDIVFDSTGNVDYLIVANAEKRLITVPWSLALFDIAKRTAVIDVTPDRLRRVPTYTIEEYPSFSTSAYRSQMDQYYGMTPERRRIIKRGNPGIVK